MRLTCALLVMMFSVTRAVGASRGSSWAAVACPSRVVTKEDVGKPIVLLGAWVRVVGAGNGTDGSEDRYPSIASLRITSNPRHGALYWRAKPVLEGDAVPAEMGWERCSEASSRAFADAWPVEDPPLATLEWPCDAVVNANAAAPTHAAAGVVVQPICAEVLYAPNADYHNWPSEFDALGNRRVPGSNPTRDEAPDAFGFEFDLTTGDASTNGGAGGGAAAMRSSASSAASVLVAAVPDPPALTYDPPIEDGGAARTGDAPALHAALLARTRVRGIALRDVDEGSFAVTVRIQSAVGNYFSVSGAGEDVLAGAVNPFRSGDGVMDAGVMEFTALPEDAARMLAALEYFHVVDDVYDESGHATDTVTVTATGGACLRSDDLSDDLAAAGELTRCPRAADVGATSVYVEIRVSGRVKDLGERSDPAWRRGFSSLLPIAASLAAATAWSAFAMWSGCAWALERSGLASIGRDDGRIGETKGDVGTETRARRVNVGFDGV